MQWWVTKGDRRPVGPVSTELLLQGIGAGMVPKDALVCEVGGTNWKSIGDIAAFKGALDQRRARPVLEPESERLAVDMKPTPPSEPPFSHFDDATEHTFVDRSPLFRPSDPPTNELHSFDDVNEKTIADAVPLRASDPPTEP